MRKRREKERENRRIRPHGVGDRVTLRGFALPHGLTDETWRREYLRGAKSAAIRDPKDTRRRIYAEYNPFKAQDSINHGNANKGTKMLVTNQMVVLFQRHVLDEKLSPYHPDKRNRGGPKPHPAMTVPGRLQIEDRPAGSSNRSRFGHYEMDTVVSSTM